MPVETQKINVIYSLILNHKILKEISKNLFIFLTFAVAQLPYTNRFTEKTTS